MQAQQRPQHIELQELGLSFDIPEGWTGQIDGDYILLGHHTIPGLMLLSENRSTNTTSLKQLAEGGIIDEGAQLKADGGFLITRNNRVEGIYRGNFQGTQVKCYAIGLINGIAEEFGIYKIYSVLNEIFLHFTTNEGKVYEYDLSVDNNSATFLDNTKYFVLSIEGCY